MTAEPDREVDPAIWEARPLYADEFYVSTTELVRLTFGEATGDAARYHTAIVMTRANAADLRDLLARVLSEDAA
jgi:hypothetical protein